MPVGRTNNDDRRGLAGIASAARPTPKRGRSPAVAKEGLVGRITSRPARRGWQKGADHCVPPRPSTRLELGGSGVMVRNFRTLDHPATRPSAAKTRANLLGYSGKWRRAGADGGGGEFLYQLSKGIYSQPCVSTGRLSEDDQHIHGGRQRATWDQPVPTDTSPRTISSVSRSSFRLSLMK